MKGFTLVELLVVIAIIAILASVVILIINPLELLKRSRDATRLKDLESLQSAINLAIQDGLSNGNDILCSGSDFPCSGKSNSQTRVNNGTGWVKVNLGSQKAVSLATLPVDPVNNSEHHYTYCADNNSWEINATLESDQQRSRMAADGGNDVDRFEVGSNFFLISSSGGSCEY